jgi:predicted O-linked N-acetylglucosamine transferase (SPINDLY family)
MPANLDAVFIEAQNQHQAGHLAAAEQGYRQVLRHFPRHADSLHLLGVIALQTGHPEQALDLVRHAVQLRPDGAIYRSNLGQVLEQLDRFDEAETAYRDAIALDSGCFEALNNLGRLLKARDRPVEAESLFQRAIQSNPDYAEPHANIGNLLKDRGDIDGAIAAHRRAIQLRPDLSMLHSNLLFTLHYHADYSAADLAREHQAWAERHVAPLAAGRAPHDNDRDPGRRIRIGYVSPDFREHVVARFLLPLLERHDRHKYELFAYSDVARPDSTTEALKRQCEHWREIALTSDTDLAAQMRDDRIDILVDLAEHSGQNRLLAFARKPAPVQITYLAYCSTTGVDAIDYRMTDRFLDPPDTDYSVYSEESIHLPDCYWCYTAPIGPPARIPPSDRLAGPPTFGCLNNFAKVSDPTLELWMRLLERAPQARLMLYAGGREHQRRVRRFLQRSGIADSRVTFIGAQPLADYLETYRRIDVALDPFPYNGGTTTCDALWMGVPVVSLAGGTAVSRAGSSVLSNAGLAEFVTRSTDDYVETAAGLLEDADSLAALRHELRSRLEQSPVMDMPRFVRGLEAAYRECWQRWCQQQQ